MLAGGQSRRFGQDKALLRLGAVTLLEQTIQRLLTVAQEVVVVGPRPEVARPRWVRTVDDDLPGAGPLAALLTGLEAAGHPLAVVVGCDLPFLDPAVLAALVELSPGWDVVAPRVGGQLQPLHAVYAKTCVPALQELVWSGVRRAVALAEGGRVRVRYVEEQELRVVDPELRSFFNLNSPEDLAQLGLRSGEASP